MPVFGIGWLLGAWLIASVAILVWTWRRTGSSKEVIGYLPFLAIVAGIIVVLLPMMIELGPDKQPLGVPVRGFGIMFMLAVVTGVGLAAWRAQQVGVDPELILSLAFVMILAGLVGARLFFIAQYWEEFFKPTVRETLVAFVNVTKGGLVVYGSVLVGVPAGIWYLRRHDLPLLAIADIIAPSMVVGLAIGRIGCFLNGCCFGGECLPPDWKALAFPAGSPTFKQQVDRGWNSGVWLAERGGRIVVDYVAPGGAAAETGLKIGEVVTRVNGERVDSLEDARGLLAPPSRWKPPLPPRSFQLETAGGTIVRWTMRQPPPRSVPVHPAQLYAAIDAGLLALVLWFFYPFRRRDGEVFALLITVHPVSRFLLEIIRGDEPGLFDTELTIAQWTSLGILAAGVALWWYIERQPAGTAFPRAASR